MGFVRRRTRRRTMLVAGGAAYAAGRAGRASQDQAEPEQVPPAPPPPGPTSGDTDVEELQKLAKLHDAGALTDDEFTAEKAKITAAQAMTGSHAPSLERGVVRAGTDTAAW